LGQHEAAKTSVGKAIDCIRGGTATTGRKANEPTLPASFTGVGEISGWGRGLDTNAQQVVRLETKEDGTTVAIAATIVRYELLATPEKPSEFFVRPPD
jgi:hypothetical protein